MVERLKRARSLLLQRLHHHVQAQPPVVATSPPPMMESDHILVLDQKHWDETQTLLAQDDPYDGQTAKFALRHPRNFA